MKELSNKIKDISPSLTLAITAKANQMKNQGINVIGFGAGEPDFNTPDNIQNAAINAMKAGFTKYTATSGITELKEAIIKKFSSDNNLNYTTSQVMVCTGGKQCIYNVFSAILNPGDEVLVPQPYWVSYPELIKLCNGIPVYVRAFEENNFKYQPNILENLITSKTKAILLNSPNNPTGAVYSKEELLKIAEIAKKYDLYIISDEMYEKLIYDDKKHISIASLSKDAYERTIVINGMSKTYAMTGWRLGYVAGNEEIIKLMTNLQSHVTSNPNTITQYASVEALNGPQESVFYMIREFKKRRDYMVNKINSINNLSCLKPEGAFYVMMNISKIIGKSYNNTIIKNSLVFADMLLEDQKVAVVPGAAFGEDNYVRLSYATSLNNIKEGLDRIEKFVAKI